MFESCTHFPVVPADSLLPLCSLVILPMGLCLASVGPLGWLLWEEVGRLVWESGELTTPPPGILFMLPSLPGDSHEVANQDVCGGAHS